MNLGNIKGGNPGSNRMSLSYTDLCLCSICVSKKRGKGQKTRKDLRTGKEDENKVEG